MAQKLYVKVVGPDGTPGTKEVHILRSWQESDGRQIYLHSDGVYGYKDHSPIQKKEEFDMITDPLQHRAAIYWWEGVGKDLSAKHYAEIAAEQERRLKEGLPEVVDGSVSELDAALYVRQPEGAKGEKGVSKPSTWPEWFNHRPDWWGHASAITIMGHDYRMVQVEDPPELKTEDTGPKKETKKKDSNF